MPVATRSCRSSKGNQPIQILVGHTCALIGKRTTKSQLGINNPQRLSAHVTNCSYVAFIMVQGSRFTPLLIQRSHTSLVFVRSKIVDWEVVHRARRLAGRLLSDECAGTLTPDPVSHVTGRRYTVRTYLIFRKMLAKMKSSKRATKSLGRRMA